jgi:hypothetical protein
MRIEPPSSSWREIYLARATSGATTLRPISRIDDLRAEIDEADRFHDGERAARAREELDAVSSELAGAVGLGGRDRRAASAAERARVSVIKAIRTAIKRIGEHDPDLGDHLARSVRTGAFCVYDPPARDRIDWRL